MADGEVERFGIWRESKWEISKEEVKMKDFRLVKQRVFLELKPDEDEEEEEEDGVLWVGVEDGRHMRRNPSLAIAGLNLYFLSKKKKKLNWRKYLWK